MTAKNRFKQEYEKGNSTSAINLPVYTDWLFYEIMKNDIHQHVRMTTDNCARFTKAFGKRAFTFIDSDRRKLSVWRFEAERGCVIYAFSHNDRGTGYEIAAPNNLTGEEVGQVMKDFMINKIFPVINEGIDANEPKQTRTQVSGAGRSHP